MPSLTPVLWLVVAGFMFLGGWWLGWRARRGVDIEHLGGLVSTLRLRSDAVCLVDTDRRVTWTNPAYLELTGYPRDELIGRSLCALLRDSVQDGERMDAASRVAEIDAALGAARELRVDLQFRRKQGDVRWMVIELHPIWNTRRRLLGYLVVQIDIDQKRREREMMLVALRDRQAVLDILDQHAIVTETDLRGRILRVNDRFVEVSGYGATELLGQNHRMVSSGRHDAHFWRGMWGTIVKGGIWHGEICNRAKDGSLYWVDSVIAPMPGRDGSPAGFISIRTDITALKRSRDMLARTGSVAGIGGWYCNLQTQTVYLTEAAQDILGGPYRQLSMRQAFSVFLPTGVRRELVCGMRQAVDSGVAFSRDIAIRRADGGRLWARISCELEWLDARTQRLVGAVQDVSEQMDARLRAESSERVLRSAIEALGEAFALYDQNERLVLFNDRYLALFGPLRHELRAGMTFEDVLGLVLRAGTYPEADADPQGWLQTRLTRWRQPRYTEIMPMRGGGWSKGVGITTQDGMHVMIRVDITELQQAVEAAQSASRSKSMFLASMSHEIRTPLNAVLGLLQLVEQTRLDADQRDLLGKVGGAARSLLGILNDILDFSKVEAGKMRLDPEPFSLDALLTDLATILCGAQGEKTLELLYDIDPGIAPVLIGDALRLKQILINLGGNAVKFTAQGEVRLRVRRLGEDASGMRLEFSVEDTGIGIRADAVDSLFTAFSQAEPSITHRFGGTGLGLPISQRLVALMGGELRVESTPGVGSRFFFEITLRPADAPPDAALAPMAPLRVLLLEPAAGSRQAISRMLHAAGMLVHAFPDAAQARQAVAHGLQPELALLSMDGPDFPPLVTDLRARVADGKGVRPVIVTTTARQSLPVQALPMLRKPLTLSMVRAALQRIAQPPAEPNAPGEQAQRLSGVRLLLVEDNEINQEVAVRLLASQGAQVRVASNGQLGVDALASSPDGYDLVLMDMQMPVLDGLQATQAIRRQPRHAALPIVAMTANTMQSDREACLAAGMNGHLGKPFVLDDLVATILRHLGRAAVVAQDGGGAWPQPPHRAAGTTPDPDTEETEDAADLAAGQAIARLGQDAAFYADLLRRLAAALPALAGEIGEAVRDRRPDLAGAAAHRLKGSALAVGAQALAGACAALEHAARAGDAETLAREAVSLTEAVARTMAAAGHWLRAHGSAAMEEAQVAPASGMRQALAALETALRDSDMAALDLCDALLAEHAQALGPHAGPLAEAMDRFDTDAALDAVRRVRTALAADDKTTPADR